MGRKARHDTPRNHSRLQTKVKPRVINRARFNGLQALKRPQEL